MTLSTLAELQAQYDALSARIAALDRDIALETDRERRAVAQEKRAELAHERERVAGDMTLQGGRPQETHIEARVGALEKDVTWIKRVLSPGVRQTAAKMIFYGLLVAIWSMWMVKEVRDWLILNPAQAVIITAAVCISALIVRWLPEDTDHDQR